MSELAKHQEGFSSFSPIDMLNDKENGVVARKSLSTPAMAGAAAAVSASTAIKRSRAQQEAKDSHMAALAASGKKKKTGLPGGHKTPRVKDSVQRMDEYESSSTAMLKAVTKSIEVLSNRVGATTDGNNLSPFSKSAKKRETLYKMLNSERALKKELEENKETDSNLYRDCLIRIDGINKGLNKNLGVELGME